MVLPICQCGSAGRQMWRHAIRAGLTPRASAAVTQVARRVSRAALFCCLIGTAMVASTMVASGSTRCL
ncbi:MAG TPA: hypothetical protein PLL69_02505, partial [Gemmatimonadales bacterium]|nr:hypothetical protein [Gemmatimonadales bacterium]